MQQLRSLGVGRGSQDQGSMKNWGMRGPQFTLLKADVDTAATRK